MRGVILAIDIGTKMGFAIMRSDGRIESGNEDFSAKKHDTEGARWLKFFTFLQNVKTHHPGLTRIAFEQVNFIAVNEKTGSIHSSSAAQVYGGFRALLQLFATLNRLEVSEYSPSTIKKRFAGHGHAKKEEVIAQCVSMGFRPSTDNEADAIAVLHVDAEMCPLLTMSGTVEKPKAKATKVPPIPTEGNPF